QKAVARFQYAKVVVHVYPGIRNRFGQHFARLPRLRVDEIKVHHILLAIQDLRPSPAFANPAETRHIRIVVVGDFYPAHLAAVAAHYSQTHAGIHIPSLGIFFPLDPGMRRQPVGDGIGRYTSLIHLQKNDLFSFRRPEEVAAHRQFFGVHPVHFAVQDVVFSFFGFVSILIFLFLFFLAGQQTFAFLSRNRMHIKIVLAHVSEPLAVRRKLRVLAGVRRRRKLHRRSRIQAVIPELSPRIEEQVFGIGRPGVGGDVIARHALFLALVTDLAHGRRKLRQLDLAYQYFFLTRHRVHIEEFAALARIVALHKRNLAAVRTPLDRLRGASRGSALREDLFNRELLRRRGLGRGVLGTSRGKQNQEVDGGYEKKFLHECTPIYHEL